MYLVANMLTKLKNASIVNKKTVMVDKTKMTEGILSILVKEGFIDNITVEDRDIEVDLKYEDKRPMITGGEVVSKPGRRVYSGHYELKPVLRGRGVGIISTSEGLMTIEQAKSKNLGGEYICKIW